MSAGRCATYCSRAASFAAPRRPRSDASLLPHRRLAAVGLPAVNTVVLFSTCVWGFLRECLYFCADVLLRLVCYRIIYHVRLDSVACCVFVEANVMWAKSPVCVQTYVLARTYDTSVGTKYT